MLSTCRSHRLQAARTSKRGSAEAQAGLLAVEGLHRQVGTGACAAGTLCAPNLPAMMRAVMPPAVCLPDFVLLPCSCVPPVRSSLLSHSPTPLQVMPFILRRTKDAVLSDLPPKIVQASMPWS